ncbi:FAD-dependent monooxygenase CTB5 [Hyphodiscus hymeniophilus]|uniref:FAD-dependent monooxygenase CTB5 n=1 Tax=Hyphodiscus hymeniophilus TaxID=353542 RepID=A0A9P6SQP4_9HELO|nr:FAD-dependent monooxygenase CTB5 [Hyphodiscus hymeniophilus]
MQQLQHRTRARKLYASIPGIFKCTSIAAVLKNKVFYPASVTYQAEESLYWSAQQEDQIPTCRIAPTSAKDVSVALSILKAQNCQFAVKSGGHASFAGASNIDGGVAIDLLNLTSFTVSSDRKQVSVGTGLRWGQVYIKLDAMGLSVIGGRNSDIGVSGLTLGGGISYFSGIYGWACDNVNNYEVVFANGSIQQVSYTTLPDLYFALRGGGNNFGIVTRLDLASFEQGKMWGGAFNYGSDTFTSLITAFHWFNINHPEDPNAAVILAFVWFSPSVGFLGSVDLEYALPVVAPPILSNFTDIPDLSNSGRITNLTDLALELAATQPAGSRETYWACMSQNDEQYLNDVLALWETETVKIMNVTGVLPVLVFQPISLAMISHMSKNGGNALGITAANGPLVLINVSSKWTYTSDDALIQAWAKSVIDKTVSLGKARGVWNRYIYQNYAGQPQDVFAGYGPVNKAKLVSIHKKYDPNDVFTKLQPGYFKID